MFPSEEDRTSKILSSISFSCLDRSKTENSYYLISSTSSRSNAEADAKARAGNLQKNSTQHSHRGGSRIFLSKGCTTKEWRHWLVTWTNFRSEYEEEGFWPGNNIMWKAENTYHTYLYILLNISCIRKPQVFSEGGRVRTPCTLPLDPPLSQQYLLFSALWIISAFFSSSSSGLSRATTIPSSWSSSPSGVIIKFSRVTCS